MNEPTKPSFIFYNCAVLPRSYSPLGAWVKYGPGPNKIEVVGRGPNWVHLSCPDRQLLLVRNALTMGGARPLDMDWDEFVPFSLTNSTAQQTAPFSQYMVNYFQHLSRPKGPGRAGANHVPNYATSPNLRQAGCTVRDGKTILADSGGFQLLTGKTEWIDPVDLAAWYTANCDQGITLDIPIYQEFEEDYLIRSAHVQAANTRILMDRLPEDFGLFNVAHGLNERLASEFREIVERDGPDDLLCVAGAYHGNIMQSLGRLVSRILDPNFKSYKQYHILGVYNVAMLIPIIRFAALMRQQGKEFTISSDASTAVYSASNRTMHLQRAHWKNPERLFLGRNTPVPVQNPYRLLPCACPVCSTLKYTDVISHVDDAIVAHSFILHNQSEIDRWVKMMVQYASTLDSSDYIELITSQMAGSPSLKSVLPTLRFVEQVAGEGLAAAKLTHSSAMGGLFSADQVAEQSGSGLFPEEADEVGDRSVRPEHSNDWWTERLDKILSTFENYHATQAPPAPVKKTGVLKRVAKKVMMNSAVIAAGTRKPPKKRVATVAKAGESTHRKGLLVAATARLLPPPTA